MSKKPKDPAPLAPEEQREHDIAHNDYIRSQRPDPERTTPLRPIDQDLVS